MRLRDIFFEITECKNDSQQRGWAVHDDQQAIVDIMEELLQILVRERLLCGCVNVCFINQCVCVSPHINVHTMCAQYVYT